MLKFIFACLLTFFLVHGPIYGMQGGRAAGQSFDISSLAHMSLGQLNKLASLLYEQAYLCESIIGALFPYKEHPASLPAGRLANDIQSVLDDVKMKVKKNLREVPEDEDDEELSLDKKNKHRSTVSLFYVLDSVAQKSIIQRIIPDFREFDSIPVESRPLFALTSTLTVFLDKIDDCKTGDSENELCAQLMPDVEQACALYEKVTISAHKLYAEIIEVLRSPEKNAKSYHMIDRYFSVRLPLSLSNDVSNQVKQIFNQPEAALKKQVDTRSINELVSAIIEGQSQQHKNAAKKLTQRKKNKKRSQNVQAIPATLPKQKLTISTEVNHTEANSSPRVFLEQYKLTYAMRRSAMSAVVPHDYIRLFDAVYTVACHELVSHDNRAEISTIALSKIRGMGNRRQTFGTRQQTISEPVDFNQPD